KIRESPLRNRVIRKLRNLGIKDFQITRFLSSSINLTGHLLDRLAIEHLERLFVRRNDNHPPERALRLRAGEGANLAQHHVGAVHGWVVSVSNADRWKRNTLQPEEVCEIERVEGSG